MASTPPPFATTDELARRIPGGLSESDVARAEAALDDVSILIRAESGRGDAAWTVATVNEETEETDYTLDPATPAILAMIAMTAARRELDNPEGTIAFAIDGYSERRANASTGAYLTADEKKKVRRAAGRTGIWTMETTRGPVETHADTGTGVNDEFLDVTGSEPIPFLPAP